MRRGHAQSSGWQRLMAGGRRPYMLRGRHCEPPCPKPASAASRTLYGRSASSLLPDSICVAGAETGRLARGSLRCLSAAAALASCVLAWQPI
jgi:hypothetical protein